MKETSFFVIETATLMDFLRTFRAPFRSLCSQCPGAVDCSSWFLWTSTPWLARCLEVLYSTTSNIFMRTPGRLIVQLFEQLGREVREPPDSPFLKTLLRDVQR